MFHFRGSVAEYTKKTSPMLQRRVTSSRQQPSPAASSRSKASVAIACKATWHSAIVWFEWDVEVNYGPSQITVVGGPLRGIDADLNAISDTVQTLARGGTIRRWPDDDSQRRTHSPQRNRSNWQSRGGIRELGAEVEELSDGLKIAPHRLAGHDRHISRPPDGNEPGTGGIGRIAGVVIEDPGRRKRLIRISSAISNAGIDKTCVDWNLNRGRKCRIRSLWHFRGAGAGHSPNSENRTAAASLCSSSLCNYCTSDGAMRRYHRLEKLVGGAASTAPCRTQSMKERR